MSSGNINIEKAGKIEARASSGSIKIGMIASFCDLSTNSGEIKIEECNLNEDSKITAKSGAVRIKKTNDIYINAKAKSGSTKIEQNNRKSDIELKIETISGGIKVNF